MRTTLLKQIVPVLLLHVPAYLPPAPFGYAGWYQEPISDVSNITGKQNTSVLNARLYDITVLQGSFYRHHKQRHKYCIYNTQIC